MLRDLLFSGRPVKLLLESRDCALDLLRSLALLAGSLPISSRLSIPTRTA
jgi:hypothetical protein